MEPGWSRFTRKRTGCPPAERLGTATTWNVPSRGTDDGLGVTVGVAVIVAVDEKSSEVTRNGRALPGGGVGVGVKVGGGVGGAYQSSLKVCWSFHPSNIHTWLLKTSPVMALRTPKGAA